MSEYWSITRINTDDYYYDNSEAVKRAGSFAKWAKDKKIIISIIIVIIGLIIICSEYFNSKKIAVYDYMNELYYNKENIETERK